MSWSGGGEEGGTITVPWDKKGAEEERRGWGEGTMTVTGSEGAWGRGGDQDYNRHLRATLR